MTTNAKKPIIAWALYDWANSAFATTVMAAFFPVFFKSYWSAGSDVTESTFQLGLANSLGSLIVVLLAPLLGAIADQGGTRRKFLFAFAFLGVLATGCLYLVTQGAWELAVVVYVLAVVGFSGANIFYDALLVEVTGRDKSDSVSALGYSLGYLGGGLLFVVNVVMVLHPTTFGLADASQAVRVSFLLVAVWWAVFSAAAPVVGRRIAAAAGPQRLERDQRRLPAAHRDLPRHPTATHHLCLPHRLLAIHRRR